MQVVVAVAHMNQTAAVVYTIARGLFNNQILIESSVYTLDSFENYMYRVIVNILELSNTHTKRVLIIRQSFGQSNGRFLFSCCVFFLFSFDDFHLCSRALNAYCNKKYLTHVRSF